MDLLNGVYFLTPVAIHHPFLLPGVTSSLGQSLLLFRYEKIMELPGFEHTTLCKVILNVNAFANVATWALPVTTIKQRNNSKLLKMCELKRDYVSWSTSLKHYFILFLYFFTFCHD